VFAFPEPPPPARPRLSRQLALRVDRLARHAHAFHRFAHHPLCPAYAPELVRLGRRTRLCRGCLLALLGVAVGFTLGLMTHPSIGLGWAILAAGVLLAALAHRHRLPKSAGRLGPAIATGICAATGLAGVAMAAGALALWLVVYRLRGPDRAPCRACPERTASPCSGFAPVVRRERAFRRLAARWIDTADRSGQVARTTAPRA
jgi:hypothetical protein